MIRKIFLMCAVMTPLLFVSQKSASAAIVKTPASVNPINILGTDYNVFFNQDDDGATSFLEVYGPNPSFTFTTEAEAQAAVDALLAAIPGDEFVPFSSSSSSENAIVPYALPNPFSFLAQRGFWNRSNGNTSQTNFNHQPITEYDSSVYSFVTFEEPTSVPTPALLPGLIGMGFSAIRKRNLAQSDEA